MSRFKLLVCFVLLVCPVAVCAGLFGTSLSADPIDSQVVDADTSQPIEGAVVVAYWEMHRGSLGGDNLPCGAANVEEAVTDAAGKFHISGWGPIHSSCDGMRSFAPVFYIFKSGYYYGRVGNHPVDPTSIVSSTHSEWNGKQLKLQKFTDQSLAYTGVKSYAANFSELNADELQLFIVDFPKECNWKKIPNTLRALIAEQQRFNAAGNNLGSIATDLVDGDESLRKSAPQCGSPKAFIEGLVKADPAQH